MARALARGPSATIVKLASHDPARTVLTRFIHQGRLRRDTPGWRRYAAAWPNLTTEANAHLLQLVEPLAELAPPALIVDKPVYSALSGKRLSDRLRAKSIECLVVSGTETDVCVLATVMAAIDIGYRVVIASDAVCGSRDDRHDSLMEQYGKRFSWQLETATTDEILAAWPKCLFEKILNQMNRL